MALFLRPLSPPLTITKVLRVAPNFIHLLDSSNSKQALIELGNSGPNFCYEFASLTIQSQQANRLKVIVTKVIVLIAVVLYFFMVFILKLVCF